MSDNVIYTNVIVSMAHEVVQAAKPAQGQYLCMRCGARGTRVQIFSDGPTGRCTPHLVSVTSGFRDQSNETPGAMAFRKEVDRGWT